LKKKRKEEKKTAAQTAHHISMTGTPIHEHTRRRGMANVRQPTNVRCVAKRDARKKKKMQAVRRAQATTIDKKMNEQTRTDKQGRVSFLMCLKLQEETENEDHQHIRA
jgi:hypothetical protein